MRPRTPPSRTAGASPGAELPADRLLGPFIFFVLGVTLAILGIRGAPDDAASGGALRGVASPAPLRIDPVAEPPADWVIVPATEDAERAAAPTLPIGPHVPG